MIIQKLLRVYPIGWTGNSIGELNRHLSQGWQVKFITDMGKNIHDYIIEIERQSITDEDVQKAIVELNNLSYSYLNAETDESVVNINIEQSLIKAVDLAIIALRRFSMGDCDLMGDLKRESDAHKQTKQDYVKASAQLMELAERYVALKNGDEKHAAVLIGKLDKIADLVREATAGIKVDFVAEICKIIKVDDDK